MTNQRERTYIQDGYVKAVDFDNNSITVITASGQEFKNVIVSSPSLSNSTQAGFHSFPSIGDRCWMTRDVNQWHVSHFGPLYDPVGKYTTQRPKLFMPGSQNVYSELSGIDILPPVLNEAGVKYYATEKLGVTIVENTSVSSNPSSTTSTTTAFDGTVLVRSTLPVGTCSSSLTTSTTAVPYLIKVNSTSTDNNAGGGILLIKDPGNMVDMPDVKITITGGNFAELCDVKANVSVSIPGIPSTLYSVFSVLAGTDDTPAMNGNPAIPGTPGNVVINLKRNIITTPTTPIGVFDIELNNSSNGTNLTVFAAVSINLFSPGNVNDNFYLTPPGYYIALNGLTDLTNIGLLFGLNGDLEASKVVLQEKDTGTPTALNTKYAGVSGAFSDFVAAYDFSGKKLTAITLDSFRLKTISGVSGPVLQAKITNADTGQLSDHLVGVDTTLNAGDFQGATKQNRGIQVTGFQDNDKFQVEIFTTDPKATPNYSGDPLLYSVNPTLLEMPQTVFATIEGENIRLGSSYVLVQTKQFKNAGTSSETEVAAPDPAPNILLGFDTTNSSTAITVVNPPSMVITLGSASMFRVSDKLVGLKLTMTQIDPLLYGVYDLAVQDNSLNVTVVLASAFSIRPLTNITSSGTSFSVNTLRQQVVAVNTKNSDAESQLYSYEVDDKGRLDIVAQGGVFVNGQPLGGAGSLSGTVGPVVQQTTFVTEQGNCALVTKDGNILISAGRVDPKDTGKGDIHIQPVGCLSGGQNSEKVFLGRAATFVQVGTESPEAHFGGPSGSLADLFPATMKLTGAPGSNSATPPDLTLPIPEPYTVVGPMLMLDENQDFTDQALLADDGTGTGETFFTLRSRAQKSGKLLEGYVHLIFVPDGAGTGKDTDPYTGSWHIPLA